MAAKQRTYSAEQIERALWTLAVCAGNTYEAARQLKAQGNEIPRSVLRNWKNTVHAERYQEIHSKEAAKIRERQAQQADELVERLHELELKTLDRFENDLANLPVRDAAGAARNLAVSSGIHTDKANQNRDRPTVTVEYKPADVEQMEAKLRRLLATDSTAEEITEAEQLPEPTGDGEDSALGG